MSRRIGYQGRFLTIWQEDVVLPGGRSIELDVVRHPGAAAIVPFENETDVVLIQQFRHAAGGTLLEVPAGKLENEAPEICAARELEEEVGRRAGRLESLGSILTTPGFTDEVIHLFAAFDLEPVPTRHESDEVIEVVRMPLHEAVDLVWRGELRDAKSALALLHAFHRYGVRS
jgi:ADP-ribose pyrophosphatase